MAILSQILKIKTEAVKLLLVGEPEDSGLVTSGNNGPVERYLRFRLLNPIVVRCSSDVAIDPFTADEVHIRESAINEDGWTFVDEKKPELGFFMTDKISKKEWVVDFSKGQMIVIYQPETIRQWAKNSRQSRNSIRSAEINAKIKSLAK